MGQIRRDVDNRLGQLDVQCSRFAHIDLRSRRATLAILTNASFPCIVFVTKSTQGKPGLSLVVFFASRTAYQMINITKKLVPAGGVVGSGVSW